MSVLTALKVSKYAVFSCPNTGNYGPEKTPYLDTFHAVTPYLHFYSKGITRTPAII